MSLEFGNSVFVPQKVDHHRAIQSQAQCLGEKPPDGSRARKLAIHEVEIRKGAVHPSDLRGKRRSESGHGSQKRLAHLHPHLPRGLLGGGDQAHEFRHLLGSHHLRNGHYTRLGPMPGRDPVGNRRAGEKHRLRRGCGHGD